MWMIILALATLTRCQEDPLPTFAEEATDFVRFSLQLDNNNELITDITQVQNVQEVQRYRHDLLDTIFVPVVLSTAPRSAPVDITFAVTSSAPQLAGDLYTLLPEGETLTFAPDEHIKYLRIAFNRVWEVNEEVELTLKLNGSSEPGITLGYPRENARMDEVSIRFGGTDIVNTYQLVQSNIAWPDDGVLELAVDFTIPALRSEIGEAPDLLELAPVGVCNDVSDLDYTLEVIEFGSVTDRLTYRLTFRTDPAPAEELFYVIRLREDLHPRYRLGSQSQAILRKSPEQTRIDLDAAALFVNPSDPFNRLFGYAWRYDDNDARCEWSRFATFTQRVAVADDDPNSNGAGFHKYKVAHRGTNVGTNPFNTRRFYSGASVESPAYWLEEAMEIFPQDANRGTLRVIPRNLEFIRRSDDQSVFIPVCGEGTYFYNTGLDAYEIDLVVFYDQTNIGGPASVTHYLKLYTRDVDVELEPIAEDCAPYLEL